MYQDLVKGNALCHTLEEVKDEILGDPLEISMFEKTNAKISSNLHPYNKDQVTNYISLSKTHKK